MSVNFPGLLFVYNYFDNKTNKERPRAEVSTSVVFDNFSLRRLALSWYSWLKPDFVSEKRKKTVSGPPSLNNPTGIL